MCLLNEICYLLRLQDHDMVMSIILMTVESKEINIIILPTTPLPEPKLIEPAWLLVYKSPNKKNASVCFPSFPRKNLTPWIKNFFHFLDCHKNLTVGIF